jgi:hypothetical protein
MKNEPRWPKVLPELTDEQRQNSGIKHIEYLRDEHD